MSIEELQVLYQGLSEDHIIGVSAHKNISPDSASANGEFVEMKIDGIGFKLYQNGVLMKMHGARLLAVAAVEEAEIVKQIKEFLEQARQNQSLKDSLCEFASYDGRRGVVMQNLESRTGDSYNLSAKDDEGEVHKIIYKLAEDRFGFVRRVLHGDKTEVLDIDEVYPKLIEIRSRLALAEQKELRAFMEVDEPNFSGARKLKSSIELYNWIKEKIGDEDSLDNRRELKTIYVKSDDDSTRLMLKSNGDILNLNKQIREREWKALNAKYQVSDEMSDAKYFDFIDEALNALSVTNVGNISIDVSFLKDNAVKKVVSGYSKFQSIFLSEDQYDKLIESCIMRDERIRQMHHDIFEHILLSPPDLHDDLITLNALREQYDLDPLNLEDLVGVENARELDRLRNEIQEMAAEHNQQEAGPDHHIINEGQIEDAVEAMWLVDMGDKGRAYEQLHKIDLTKNNVHREVLRVPQDPVPQSAVPMNPARSQSDITRL